MALWSYSAGSSNDPDISSTKWYVGETEHLPMQEKSFLTRRIARATFAWHLLLKGDFSSPRKPEDVGSGERHSKIIKLLSLYFLTEALQCYLNVVHYLLPPSPSLHSMGYHEKTSWSLNPGLVWSHHRRLPSILGDIGLRWETALLSIRPRY